TLSILAPRMPSLLLHKPKTLTFCVTRVLPSPKTSPSDQIRLSRISIDPHPQSHNALRVDCCCMFFSPLLFIPFQFLFPSKPLAIPLLGPKAFQAEGKKKCTH